MFQEIQRRLSGIGGRKEADPKQHIPVLPWYDIRPAVPREMDPKQDYDLAKDIYGVCRQICIHNDYYAVAGTQIPDYLLPILAVEHKNFIYIHGKDGRRKSLGFSLQEALIFNPESKGMGIPCWNIDACGSFPDDVVFVTMRPEVCTLSGFGFRPDWLRDGFFSFEETLDGSQGQIVQHEMEHYKGGCVINNSLFPFQNIQPDRHYPSLFIDPIQDILRERISKNVYTSILTVVDNQVVLASPRRDIPFNSSWKQILDYPWDFRPFEKGSVGFPKDDSVRYEDRVAR